MNREFIGSAIAQPNIALIKYWGKRGQSLHLPNTSSIGVTLDKPHTHTTVRFNLSYKRDRLVFNGELINPEIPFYQTHIAPFLHHVKLFFGMNVNAHITTTNDFPRAAGLASSSSGFAALSGAINQALQLNLSEKELSILARIGSGSASRSICGGFVEWQKGSLDEGTDSFSFTRQSAEHWPDLRVILCVLHADEKTISSRKGMEITSCSPFYPTWLKHVEQDLSAMRRAISERNFQFMGEVAERNALLMHATMLGAKPPLLYLSGETLELMKSIWGLRDEGLSCYFTLDAGPNLKILTLVSAVGELVKHIKKTDLTSEIIICRPGAGARPTHRHLPEST